MAFAQNEFPEIDAWVLILTGVVGLAIAVFRLISKKPEIVRKRKNFIFILAISLVFLAAGAYLLASGEDVSHFIRRIRGR